MPAKRTAVRVSRIESRIVFVRGQKVIVDADLASFYGVSTKRLNEQVKRNRERFPEDFMFQLVPEEKSEVVASCDHLSRLKFSSALPYAFTEHGAIMAASVFIVRAFVKIRGAIFQDRTLAERIAALERRLAGHDEEILSLIQAIKQLIDHKATRSPRRIGFRNPT